MLVYYSCNVLVHIICTSVLTFLMNKYFFLNIGDKSCVASDVSVLTWRWADCCVGGGRGAGARAPPACRAPPGCPASCTPCPRRWTPPPAACLHTHTAQYTVHTTHTQQAARPTGEVRGGQAVQLGSARGTRRPAWLRVTVTWSPVFWHTIIAITTEFDSK